MQRGKLVMEAASQNTDFVREDLVDKPVFLIDPPGPASGQLMLQRLWFTHTRKRLTLDFTDQPDDS